MFVTYVAKTTWTMSQVMSDMHALMTGTTDLNTLSASCDVPSSSIITTVAAGWSSHDSADGSANGGFVVSCADYTGTNTKYARFYSASTTQIQATVCEGWNASTNAATNQSNPGNTAILTAGSSFTMFIAIKPRYILMRIAGYNFYVLEFSRDTEYVSSTSRNFVIGYTTSGGPWYATKIWRPHSTERAEYTAGNAILYAMAIGNTYASGAGSTMINTGTYYRQSDNTSAVFAVPMYLGIYSAASTNQLALAGKVLGDIYLAMPVAYDNTIVYNSKTYYLFSINSGGSMGLMAPME